MNDEEFEQFVRHALRPRKTPEVSEEEIREFLAPDPDISPGDIEEVRARFIGNVFRKLHPKPLWEVGHGEQFGPWFRAVRKSTRLPLEEIAAAIGESASFMEQLESGESPPWQLDHDSVARLMILYRVNIQAVKTLVQNAEEAKVSVTPSPSERRNSQVDIAAMIVPQSGTELIDDAKYWLYQLYEAIRRRGKAKLLLEFKDYMGLTLGDSE
jgi:transcriptional regulator with XRE-family HTH domain